MRNVSRDHLVAAFAELIAEDQIQTAVELLVAAEPDEQLLAITESSPDLLHSLFQALDVEDRLEVTRRLSDAARDRLLEILTETAEPEDAVTVTTPSDEVYLAAEDVAEMFPSVLDDGVDAAVVESAEFELLAGRRDFAIVEGRLRESAPSSSSITIYTDPSGPAQRQLLEALAIDEHTLASALDPDEIARLEHDPDDALTVIVWKRPWRETVIHPELLGLTSIGLFFQPDHLTIVTAGETALLRAGDRASSVQDVLLRMMAATVNEFLVELKAVKRTSREIQDELSRSIENREFLRMFQLSEGLVYHINAIDANGGVLRKLRALAPRIGFDEPNLELLEDILIDNNQCSRQGQVFSTVLAGMLDARGNLINNNMNVLLKNLTIVNVIFLPLTVITGIGGMSEYGVMLDDHGIGWGIGYAVFTVALLGFGVLLWMSVRAYINRTWAR
ncbi:MAG TPA: CorA family divalent cation transporter [Thermomicrobiales bacterium]|nr:CorA family divalent cation transporter [Thermomicrobiales bacterium]